MAKYPDWLTPEGLTRLTGWAGDGLSNEQIAANIGINPDTLYEWKSKYSEIAEALKKGKEVADYEVENALFRRATGYDYTEERVEIEGRKRKVVQTVKHVVPDTAAAFIWLKNRRPDKWRDKPETDRAPDMSLMHALIDVCRDGEKE